MTRRPVALLVLPLIVVLAACAATPAASSGKVQVVASTDVWGDIAASIGGGHVQVTSIIDDPDKDPHEYQADARTQLAVSKAQLLIENGGGYDDFVGTMLSASKNTKATVVDAVKLSGFDTSAADFNEHVWYDYPTVDKVADAVAADLGKLDPAHASAYEDNAATFHTGLAKLESREVALSATTAGVGAAITEPVPDYLLQALKMDIRTPVAFSKAIEDDTDVAPAVLQQTLALFPSGAVKVLAYNEQTTGPQTEAVLSAAKSAGVPTVPVTETLPRGTHYLGWQDGVITAIAHALGDR